MEQFLPFITSHWQLFAALAVILVLILVFETKMKSDNPAISPQEMVEWINRQNAVVLDIRPQEAFNKGHIVDAVSVEAQHAASILKQEKHVDKPIVVVCAKGIQAAKIAQELRKEGAVKVAFLKGGIDAWISADFPLVKKGNKKKG